MRYETKDSGKRHRNCGNLGRLVARFLGPRPTPFRLEETARRLIRLAKKWREEGESDSDSDVEDDFHNPEW